jgi:excisionase family DNA binding protein
MLNVEIRFVMQGKEVSVDSFVEAIVREVRATVREEISRTFPKHEQQGSDSPRRFDSEVPRQAVSVREAARLLSISPRTVDKYVALKAIPTIRVGRRVLIPMKSVSEIVSKGISKKQIRNRLASASGGLQQSSEALPPTPRRT